MSREVPIDAPITVQSLTAPVGGRPWQQPPQYASVEEAMEYYIPKLEDPEFAPELLTVIELGVPLTTIANSMQLSSVMEGKHTIDVGILMIPLLVELMTNLAEANNVPYKSGMEKPEGGGISEATIALARKKGKIGKPLSPEPEALAQEGMPPSPQLPQEQAPMGLMTRREQ